MGVSITFKRGTKLSNTTDVSTSTANVIANDLNIDRFIDKDGWYFSMPAKKFVTEAIKALTKINATDKLQEEANKVSCCIRYEDGYSSKTKVFLKQIVRQYNDFIKEHNVKPINVFWC